MKITIEPTIDTTGIHMKNDINPSEAARFNQKVNVEGPFPQGKPQYSGLGRCAIWRGSLDRDGYGSIYILKKYTKAHRASWMIHVGPIPDGLCVLHRCDNPSCVRPDHLFLGTNIDNIRDRDEKGRASCGDRHYSRIHPEKTARGDRHGFRLHPEKCPRGDKNGARIHKDRMPRGEGHCFSKLTENIVREIRVRYGDGGVTCQMLAEEFGVWKGTIHACIKRKTWAHL